MYTLRKILKLGKPAKKFSEVFKKKVVREYERGLLNKDQLMRKYQLGGKSLVLEWCRSMVNLPIAHLHKTVGR